MTDASTRPERGSRSAYSTGSPANARAVTSNGEPGSPSSTNRPFLVPTSSSVMVGRHPTTRRLDSLLQLDAKPNRRTGGCAEHAGGAIGLRHHPWSGRLRLGHARRAARARTEPLNAIARAQPPAPEHAFPVRGRYDWGTAVNGFGGGRGHDGQDIFARCGTRRRGPRGEGRRGGDQGRRGQLRGPRDRRRTPGGVSPPAAAALRERGRPARGGGRRRPGRADRQRAGLPPALRALDRPGPVHGRSRPEPRPALDRWASDG